MNSAKSEIESMAEKLKILEEKNRPSSPGKATPYHGRWSAMRSASRKVCTNLLVNIFLLFAKYFKNTVTMIMMIILE